MQQDHRQLPTARMVVSSQEATLPLSNLQNSQEARDLLRQARSILPKHRLLAQSHGRTRVCASHNHQSSVKKLRRLCRKRGTKMNLGRTAIPSRRRMRTRSPLAKRLPQMTWHRGSTVCALAKVKTRKTPNPDLLGYTSLCQSHPSLCKGRSRFADEFHSCLVPYCVDTKTSECCLESCEL